MTINELKEKFVPDQEAQNAVWAHSCSTTEEIENLLGSNAEICVTKISDPHFSKTWGVFVKGRVTLMSCTDLNSWPTKNGREFARQNAEKYIVSKYADLKPQKDSGFNYTESWVIPQEIVGVWVYDYIVNRAKTDEFDAEDLKDFCKDYPVTIISSSK